MKRQITERKGQPRRELSGEQRAAVELLAAGKSDKQAAEALDLPAERVAKWRRYDPVFQAALNACRAEVWQASIDRLRSIIPQALDTLAEELNRGDNSDRCKLALDILRLAKLPNITPEGPADPETIVRQVVDRERRQASDQLDDLLEEYNDLPSYEEHLTQKWAELEARAADEPQQGSAGPCRGDPNC